MLYLLLPTIPGLLDATMSSHPKRGEEDLLRQVPDDILCHILSFLPSKEAAKTCVLSKRWRHLFLRVRKLIAMGRKNDLFTRNTEVNQEMNRFIHRWIMSSEEAPVDEFRLRSTYFLEPSVFYLWLTTLLLRRIKVLELKAEGFAGRPTTLLFPPAEFFRSETLVALSITGNEFVLNIPDFVCYSNLKTLHLEELHAVDSSGHFRFTDAGYPRLEEFCLKCVHFRSAATEEYVELFEDESILTISLATLKMLVVYYDTHMIDRVDIDTKHLEQLQFTVESEVDMKVNFSKCESLVYADIYQFNPGESYFKLLSKINNVKTLRISDHSPEDYIGVVVPFPQFNHLTHLKLRETAHQSVWNLLHHAPNLEVLDFIMSFKYEDYLPPEVVPQCLSQSLKQIRIKGYKWYEDYIDDDDIEDDDEVGDHAKIVEYFLQHGAVLEKMSLGHSKIRTAEWRQSTLNLFQNLDRLSQNCEIDLLEE